MVWKSVELTFAIPKHVLQLAACTDNGLHGPCVPCSAGTYSQQLAANSSSACVPVVPPLEAKVLQSYPRTHGGGVEYRAFDRQLALEAAVHLTDNAQASFS